MRFLLPLCLGALLLFNGCDHAPSHEQVSGTYSGVFKGVRESLALRADGTLTQEVHVPNGRTFNAMGTWTLKHEAVTLNRYLYFCDEARNGVLAEPHEVYGITYGWNDNVLYRECGTEGYGLNKQK